MRELKEVTARHALERAQEEAEDADAEERPVSYGTVQAAVTSAIEATFEAPGERRPLRAVLARSLSLYGTSPDTRLTRSEQLRVQFMITHQGVRAALPGASDRELQLASDRLQRALDGLPEPVQARPDGPVSGWLPFGGDVSR